METMTKGIIVPKSILPWESFLFNQLILNQPKHKEKHQLPNKQWYLIKELQQPQQKFKEEDSPAVKQERKANNEPIQISQLRKGCAGAISFFGELNWISKVAND